MITSGKIIANLLINNLKGELKRRNLSIIESPIKFEALGFLGRAIQCGALTQKQVKEIIINWMKEYDTGRDLE